MTENIRRKILSQEKSAFQKKGRLNILLFYPNNYEIAITSLAFHRILEVINRFKEIGIRRYFLEGQGSKELLALDGETSLNEVDLIAFFLSYEMEIFNIIRALKLLKIPLYRDQRSEAYPLLVVGGVVVTENPEPFAEFFDVLFIGEAEESLPAFLSCLFQSERREEVLEKAGEIEGLYIPSTVKVSYDERGLVKNIEGKKVVRGVYRRFHEDFSKTILHTKPGKFGDTFLIELTRGCPGQCGFCISRTLYQPVRFAQKDKVISLISDVKEEKRIGLLGASVSFHPNIKEIMEFILLKGKEFSISSLRAEKVDREFAELLKRGGTKTITIAPEAGSERLRRIINKGISEEDIERAIINALQVGIEQLKMYFMIGLPFEEKEDVEAIVKLAKLVRQIEKGCNKRFKKVTFSVNPFVPKPFTPFQWAYFSTLKDMKEKMNYLRKSLAMMGISVLSDSLRWAQIEAVISRGDRRLASFLAEGRKNVSDQYITFYGERRREEWEIFPWDFIDMGIKKEKLLQQWKGLENKIKGLSI